MAQINKGEKSFQEMKEKTHKSYKRFSESFHLPTIIDEPLLNFLAYSAAMGFAVKTLGLVPFDVVNLDLKDLKRKRRSLENECVAIFRLLLLACRQALSITLIICNISDAVA